MTRNRERAPLSFAILVVGAAVTVALALGGCSKPPGEQFLDTSIKDLVGQGPGLYELSSPFDVPSRGSNFVFLRQGKDMIIAAGDTLQEKIQKYMSAGAFSLVGRRMGQPKIWFAVDGVIVKGQLVERIGHRVEWQFPSYEQFDRALVQEYAPVDLTRFDFDKDDPLKRDLMGKKVRITGTLRISEPGPGVKRYVVESRNLKLELSPVGANLGYFLDLASAIDTPFVAYGRLTALNPIDDGSDRDRGSTQIAGPFVVDFLRYSQDILVRNAAAAPGA